MIINLITSDFKGSSYLSNTDCPLARALKRIFIGIETWAGGSYVRVNHKRYDFMELETFGLWDCCVVESLIDRANEGLEVSYQLEIPGL